MYIQTVRIVHACSSLNYMYSVLLTVAGVFLGECESQGGTRPGCCPAWSNCRGADHPGNCSGSTR